MKCDNCGLEKPIVGMMWYARAQDYYDDGPYEEKAICIDCYGSRREGPLYPKGEHRT